MTHTPLDASDSQRASAVTRKILERLTDVERHYRALEAAMAEFGEEFGREEFASAATSEDPAELWRGVR